MAFLAVKKFQWIEPKVYRENQDRAAAAFWSKLWWLRPVFIFGVILLGAFIGWAEKALLHMKSLAGTSFGITMLLVLSVLLLYGMPWLIRRLPASVTLYSTGIMKMGDQYIFPFKGMTGYQWLQMPEYYVLLVTTKRNGLLSYGVPDPMTRDRIDAALLENGVSRSTT